MVSVPNVAHFDLGLRLLCGRWTLSDTGLLDSTHLRFFTEKTLERMLERCGWRVVARDDFIAIHTDQYDDELNDGLPVEMVGALRALSESYNPQASVQQFVWTLAALPGQPDPPTSYLGAMAEPAGARRRRVGRTTTWPSARYLASVGLVCPARPTVGRPSGCRSGPAVAGQDGWSSRRSTGHRGWPHTPRRPTVGCVEVARDRDTARPVGAGRRHALGAVPRRWPEPSGAVGLNLVHPDDRMDWPESNPEHWESLWLSVFNEDLLARLDGAWDAPPDTYRGWEHSPAITGARDPGRLLAAAYPEPGPKVCKDPRLCLLLPYWRQRPARPPGRRAGVAVAHWPSPSP